MPTKVPATKRPNANQRKRVGAHHNKNKAYAKAYWPYLPVLLIAIVAVVINITWFNKGVLDYAIDTNSAGLLTSTNSQRVENGLPELTLNSVLTNAAQAKANDMVARNYWSHVTPDGEQPWVFITAAGYSYQTAGENLAYGFATSNDTVIGWMNSPGHRANILNNTFTEVGFGIANSVNFDSHGHQTVVVAMYASPYYKQTLPLSTKQQSPPAQSTPAPSNQPRAPTIPTEQATPVEESSSDVPTSNLDDTLTPVTNDTKPKSEESTKSIARIQLLSGDKAPWVVLVVAVVLLIAGSYYIIKHGRAWRKVITKGEKFIIKHKFLDILIIVIIVGCILLAQDVVGFIK